MPWNAYIDESGDRGWRFRPAPLPAAGGTSSRMFCMSAILVPAATEQAVLALWDTAARKIGRTPPHVVHWVNVRGHSQRRYLVDAIAGIPDAQLVSVALCKRHLPNVSVISQPDALYNWTFRLMLERLSWFGEHLGDTVTPTFAQVSGLSNARLAQYEQRLRQIPTYIKWARLRPYRIDNPANRRMLQLADSVAGSVFAAFEPDAFGYTNQVYLESLRSVIWRRPGRPMHRDGMKFGPWPAASCDTEHPWFQEFCDR